MTIQELINELQYSIDELGYRPDTHIQVDMEVESIDYVAGNVQDTYWELFIDNDNRSDNNPKNWKIAINVYDDEEETTWI